MSETIHRFDDRVQDYLQGRPGYPAGIIPVLEAQVGLQPGWTVVDLGVGTGLLSRVFLDAGCRVVGVEPSPQMAEAGRVALADAPGFRMVEGQAEATGLDDEVAELVVAAQAFHWFDPDAAAREWQRILRPPRALAIIWNRRPKTGSAFAEAYEAFLQAWGIDYGQVSERYEDPAALARVFEGGAPAPVLVPHVHRQDRSGLQARLRSSSYMPGREHPRHAAMMAAADSMFDAHAVGGWIETPYDTAIYAGRLRGEAPERGV